MQSSLVNRVHLCFCPHLDNLSRKTWQVINRKSGGPCCHSPEIMDSRDNYGNIWGVLFFFKSLLCLVFLCPPRENRLPITTLYSLIRVTNISRIPTLG